MKLDNDESWEYAGKFSAFIDHFLGKGASTKAIKQMLSKMVDAVELERKSLT